MKTSPVLLSLALCLLTCGEASRKVRPGWKTIEIGDYLIDFPEDFKLVELQGIDSYVGKVVGDSMWFGFDFGYYSDQLELSPQEYVEEGGWKINIPFQFMKPGVSYNQDQMPKVEVLSVRTLTAKDEELAHGFTHVARCRHENREFDYKFSIPEESKQVNFKIDSINHHFRKIIWAKDPQKGTTGIYMKDLNSFSKSMNSSLALSMATGKLTHRQQKLALEIFETVRHKPE